MILLVLQNVVTYSVNVADNVMLGAYSQTALSAAAAVNQIQYILQQVTIMGIGEGVVILAGQYWGKGDKKMIEKIAGVALTIGIVVGILLIAAAALVPERMIGLFTEDAEIIREGVSYLKTIKYTYVMFIVYNVLLSVLRSVQRVRIAFFVSAAGLCVNAGINYILIFGKFGAPEMGIAGAAIGTLVATAVELLIVILYIVKNRKTVIALHPGRMFRYTRALVGSYLKVAVPCIISAVIFSSAVAIQTMIFGHMNADALAASSVAGTFFQYAKMLPTGTAAAAAVLIAKEVGAGKTENLRQMVNSLQAVFIGIGLIAGTILFTVRVPILSTYVLTEQARSYAMQQMLIQSFVEVAMSYQMPSQIGIIRPGGDSRYSMISDFIYSWVIVIPLSLIAVFVLHCSFAVAVFCLNIDQFLKCITVTIKVRSYTWVHVLTKS